MDFIYRYTIIVYHYDVLPLLEGLLRRWTVASGRIPWAHVKSWFSRGAICILKWNMEDINVIFKLILQNKVTVPLQKQKRPKEYNSNKNTYRKLKTEKQTLTDYVSLMCIIKVKNITKTWYLKCKFKDSP